MAESELDSWVATLASELGVTPESVPVQTLLDVARDAAHGVTRPAAPLATFLVGYAAASGMSVDEACAKASAAARAWQERHGE